MDDKSGLRMRIEDGKGVMVRRWSEVRGRARLSRWWLSGNEVVGKG